MSLASWRAAIGRLPRAARPNASSCAQRFGLWHSAQINAQTWSEKKIIRSQLPSNSFTDAAAKPFPVGAAYAVPYGVSEHSQIQCLLCDKGLASAVPC